jgi:O-antigen/teichoic acid export membrane protein
VYGITVVILVLIAMLGFRSTLASLLSSPALAELIPAVALVTLVATLGAAFEARARRELNFRLQASAFFLSAPLGFSVTVVATAIAGLGVWGPILGALVSAVITTGVYLRFGLRRRLICLPRISLSDFQEIFRFGTYRIASNLTNFVNSYSDQSILATIAGPATLGPYNVASGLTLRPTQLINPVLMKVALPVFARVQEDDARLLRIYLRAVRFIVFVQAPIIFGMIATADVLVPLYLGERWRDLVPVVQALALVALGRAMVNPTGSVLLAKNKPEWAFRWNLALLCVFPPTVFLAAMTGEILVVALSLACVQLVLVWVQYMVLLRPLFGPFGKALAHSILVPFVCGGLMGAGVYALAQYLPLTGLLGLLALVGAGALFYLALASVLLREEVRDGFRVMRP